MTISDESRKQKEDLYILGLDRKVTIHRHYPYSMARNYNRRCIFWHGDINILQNIHIDENFIRVSYCGMNQGDLQEVRHHAELTRKLEWRIIVELPQKGGSVAFLITCAFKPLTNEDI